MQRLKILTGAGHVMTTLSDEEALVFIERARAVWEGAGDTMLGCVTVAGTDHGEETIHIRASAVQMISVLAVPDK